MLCEAAMENLKRSEIVVREGRVSIFLNIVFSYGLVMKQDRRRIESEFFSGKLRGIAATNALELGIDVGHVDVTLHLGFPGSIAR